MDYIDTLRHQLRELPAAQRLDVEIDLGELPSEDPRLREIAELLLEAPTDREDDSTLRQLGRRLRDRPEAGAADDEWLTAAVAAQIRERTGEPFAAMERAAHAASCGAPREPWVRWLDTPEYAAYLADIDLLHQPWELVEGQIRIRRVPRSTGPRRAHRILALAQVGDDDGSYWSVIPDGGPELFLTEEDMLELERTFNVSRIDMGGRDIQSSAITPVRAILEPLLARRIPAIEGFIAKLADAIPRALDTRSVDPLATLFTSHPGQATAAFWFAQAVVGKQRDDTRWNPGSGDALRERLGLELEIEARRGVVGTPALGVGFSRGETSVALSIGSSGAIALKLDGAWQGVTPIESPLAMVARARELLDTGDCDDALEILDAAAAIHGADEAVAATRADAFYGVGRTDDAFAEYVRLSSILRGPEKLHVMTNLAALYRERGDRAGSDAIERRLVEEMPDEPEAWHQLGLSQVKGQQYTESIASEQRTLELDPYHASAHWTLACAYLLRDGNRELALEHIANALECDPDLAGDIAQDDDFAPLRDDLRFRRLVGDD